MSVYIIAECGQNHNGNIRTARELIDMAAMPVYHEGKRLRGVDAVKFTKRDLDAETTVEMWDAPYDSPHAYGGTYGAHRAALELSDKEHGVLSEYAHAKGLDFIETVCNPGALSVLRYAKVDRLKIASRDLTNVPLLRAVNNTRMPVILSTGMYPHRLTDALELLPDAQERWILHCISTYPAAYSDIALRSVPWNDGCVRGYSDHTTGTQAAPWAVILGAQIIEKHVTLDRGMTGTDHAGSVDHEGLRRVVRDIRNAELARDDRRGLSDYATLQKLGRSVCAARDIEAGELVTEMDFHMLSPGSGMDWRQAGMSVFGKAATRRIGRNEMITAGQFE